jgi:hypothetical protein
MTPAPPLDEVREALKVARQFIDPDRDPPRMTNRELVKMIDTALAIPKATDHPTAYYYEIQRGDPPCAWEAKLSFTKPEAPEVFRNVRVVVEADAEGLEEIISDLRRDKLDLIEAIKEACDLLAERRHGNPARSAGHNARLCMESALSKASPVSSTERNAP